MSVVPDRIRQQIAKRAGHCCEYCQLPEFGQVATFPIDHVVPQAKGGPTSLENLALCCPRCNGRKWVCELVKDPLTGESVPLFNPRHQIWSDHFAWTADLHVVGKTAVGRATVDRLLLNHPRRLEARQLLRLLKE